MIYLYIERCGNQFYLGEFKSAILYYVVDVGMDMMINEI